MKPIFLLILAAPMFAATPTLEIKVDQVGYLQHRRQDSSLVASKTLAVQFTVKNSKDDKVAFHGTLPAPVEDFDSGDRVQAGDFGG